MEMIGRVICVCSTYYLNDIINARVEEVCVWIVSRFGLDTRAMDCF